jgi:hypothetical protein
VWIALARPWHANEAASIFDDHVPVLGVLQDIRLPCLQNIDGKTLCASVELGVAALFTMAGDLDIVIINLQAPKALQDGLLVHAGLLLGLLASHFRDYVAK